jgi:acetyl esterase/lipase
VTLPANLQPFVVPYEPHTPERHDKVDLYLPDAEWPRPAVLFVHGGPVPAALRPTPRDWPVYRAYGSLAAARGVVGVTLDHRLHDPASYPLAAADVVAAVELARAHPRVDPDRVALWFFSGAGPLLADWLRTPPPWLRCVAATYPLLAPLPGAPVDGSFQPDEALAGAGALPIVLTRIGWENPQLAATVEAFIEAARACRAQLEIIDVPNGQHGFDTLDHTDESREAVERALDRVLAALA